MCEADRAANALVTIRHLCYLPMAFETPLPWALQDMVALQVELLASGNMTTMLGIFIYLHVCPGKQKMVVKIIHPLLTSCEAAHFPVQG